MTNRSNYIELDLTNLKNTKFVPIPEALKKYMGVDVIESL